MKKYFTELATGGVLFACLVSPAYAYTEALEYDCIVKPSIVSDVGTEVSGVVDKINVERGDEVAMGEVMVSLKPGVQRASVRLAEERVKAAANVNQRKARSELAKRIMERSKELYKSKSLSLQAMEQAETDARIAKLLLYEAYEDKTISQLELERANEVLALRQITSPVSGLVVDVMIAPGERVDEEPLLRVAQIDPLYVEVIVPAIDIDKIHAGLGAKVMLAEPIGGTYDADIVIVDKIIDAASGTFGVRAKLPNPDKTLPAGLQCRVVFNESASASALAAD